MSFPTDRQLFEICGLNSDGIAGYRAEMSARGRVTLPPLHLVGPRRENFRRGVNLAIMFRAARKHAGITRRQIRNAEYREVGAKTVLMDAASHRQEREYLLRLVSCNLHKAQD